LSLFGGEWPFPPGSALTLGVVLVPCHKDVINQSYISWNPRRLKRKTERKEKRCNMEAEMLSFPLFVGPGEESVLFRRSSFLVPVIPLALIKCNFYLSTLFYRYFLGHCF
jgi:hypothetical protein